MWSLHGNLISLRDMAGGHWSVDTLYLLHDTRQSAALRQVADGWSADEIDLVPDQAVPSLLGVWAANNPAAILRVWWD